MEISFEGVLSKDEYLKINQLHNPHKKLGYLLKMLIPLLILVAIYQYFIQGKISYFLLFLILFWIYYLLIKRYRLGKYWKESKGIKEKFSGVINEKGISITGETATSNKSWDYFSKFKASSDIILLYQSYTIIHFFSKSFFKNDSDWDSFVTIVKNNVPSK